jgi:hypothetical protein
VPTTTALPDSELPELPLLRSTAGDALRVVVARHADGNHRRLRRHGLDDLGLLGLALLEVVAVAEHAEVPGLAVVGVDRDPRQDLLALVEAEPLQVEVREPDAVGGVRRVLAVVRVDPDLERAQVLGDLRGVGHRG